MTPAITVERLVRRFDDLTAVRDLSFSVPEGSICAFLGPNGAGKTTTLRILATLEMPTSGAVRVGRYDVVAEPHQVRKVLGYMPDDPGTVENLLVDEYIDLFARLRGLYGDARRREVDRVVAFTGLGRLLRRPVDALSKGERQRLSLTRALLGEPRVLLLDEPAAGLDPRARVELREALKGLARLGVTVLISSHVLTELAELVDRVVIIAGGELRFSGTLDELNRVSRGERVVVKVHGEDGAARRFFLQHPKVADLSGADGELHVHLTGDGGDVPELMAEAIGAGLRFEEFYRPKADLEDAFITLATSPEDE
jgi:ABC-2 type transport system ATP-binding protein